MNIKVLGSGCAKCQKLEENTRKAIQELGIEAVIEHVTEYAEIASYQVMQTPALVVDGQVKVVGQVPSPKKIKALL